MKHVSGNLALWLLLLPSVAGAATGVRMESDTGDWIGLGQTFTFDTVQISGSNTHVTAAFGAFYADFAVPSGATLATGARFSGATRWPFNSPTWPGLSVHGEGRGCNTLTGWFQVREALFATSGEIARLAIDFKQNCEGLTAALYGAIRFNSDIPAEIPDLVAITGRSQNVLGRDVVVLNAGQSFARGGLAPPVYSWTQIEGTPVALHGAATSLVDFTAPLVPPGGEDLRFRLTVTSGTSSDTDEVRIHVGSKTDPQSYIYFRSDAGDYIGAGKTFKLTPWDGTLELSKNYRGGPSFVFNGDASWRGDFGPAVNAPFAVGPYEGAQRFPFAAADRPGISVYGDGRGCNAIVGRFDVIDVGMDGSGNFDHVGLNYEQHCEGGAPALFGELRWNYVEPDPPIADAGSNQIVVEGNTVVLDGSASTDNTGVAHYQWRQLQGPEVMLRGPQDSRASFVAPEVTGEEVLQFRLVVGDGNDLTGADTVEVTIKPTSGSKGGGTIGPGALLLLLAATLLRAGTRFRRMRRFPLSEA